jgi:hypothetical protein
VAQIVESTGPAGEQLAMLQVRAADLGELVIEERVSFDEAIGAYNVRHREQVQAEQEALPVASTDDCNFVQAIAMIDGVLALRDGEDCA